MAPTPPVNIKLGEVASLKSADSKHRADILIHLSFCSVDATMLWIVTENIKDILLILTFSADDIYTCNYNQIHFKLSE